MFNIYVTGPYTKLKSSHISYTYKLEHTFESIYLLGEGSVGSLGQTILGTANEHRL